MNKLLLFAAAGLLLVGGLLGYVIHGGQSFGTTYLGYQSAQNSLPLYNVLSSLITDVTNARAPLAGLLTGSANFALFSVSEAASSTNAWATSTPITITGAAVGDTVLVGVSTSTTGIVFTGNVTAANTVTVYALNTTLASTTIAATTVYATVLPRASFVAPTAIGTVATTTTN